ncbi:MAG: hypothetical protein R3200_16705 [Xanthomonadales bacterium]|nr:hypothetical protein [Xanthomonadales bacterium]
MKRSWRQALARSIAVVTFLVVLAACAHTPTTMHIQPVDLESCRVRQCMGPELECRRESRNQIYTARNWRCLAGR